MSNNSSINNRRIVKNTIFLYSRLVITMLISLYTTRVVLNVLGVVDFGIYNVVCGFVAMFSFFNTTMSNGIQRFYNYEAGKNGIESITKVYQTAMLIQIVMALFILLVVEPLGIWYINNRMVIPEERIDAANWVFQCSLISLLFLVMQVPFSAAVMAYEKMNFFACVGISDAILKLFIVIILPYIKNDSLIIYGLLSLLVNIITFSFFLWYALKNFKELRLSRILHKDLFKKIFKFSGWNLVEMFAWTTQIQGVNMVMNYFCGPVVNAAQGVASMINSALNSFCLNLSIAFRPQLVHSYAEGNYVRTTVMMFTMSKAMFVMMAIMIIPLSFEMNYILGIWLGNKVPEYTQQFATLIIFSMFPRNMIMVLSQVVHASGKMKTYQLGSAAVILLALPLSYLLLKSGNSPVLIYVSNIVLFVLLWMVDLYLLKSIFEFSFKEYFKKLVVPSIFTFIISLIIPYWIHLSMSEGLARFFTIIVVNTIVVFVVAFFLLLKRTERQVIMDIFNKYRS